MKIALTVKGVGLGAWLDDDFAHCGFVMIVDDDNRFDSWKNPTPEVEGDANHELTDIILQEKPDILMTSKISAAEKAAFMAQDIHVLEDQSGFVLELLEIARDK
jgi:predicted Fe-Mo cluster-binding NifX family protein